MRRKAHVRFGGRSEETGWLKGQYRASPRSNFVKVRDNGRVVSQAIVIAIGVTASGEREVLGLDVGPSESGAFWLAFLRDLAARGLNGVKLVISDAHAGLKAAIGAVLQGASWQRCRVHFMLLSAEFFAHGSAGFGVHGLADVLMIGPPRARQGEVRDRRWPECGCVS